MQLRHTCNPALSLQAEALFLVFAEGRKERTPGKAEHHLNTRKRAFCQ